MSDAKQTVLIVEDHDDLRRLFCLALKLHGFTVVEAANGYDALMVLESRHIDLVVLDLRLPDIDGFIVLEEIEAQAPHDSIPVVIVTAAMNDLSHLRVARILRKPVLPEDLVEVVRQSLPSHKTE